MADSLKQSMNEQVTNNQRAIHELMTTLTLKSVIALAVISQFAQKDVQRLEKKLYLLPEYNNLIIKYTCEHLHFINYSYTDVDRLKNIVCNLRSGNKAPMSNSDAGRRLAPLIHNKGCYFNIV